MCCVAFLVFFFVLHSQQTMRLPQSSSFAQHAKQVSLSVMSPFCMGECAFSTRVLGLASEYMQYTVIA